MESLPTRYDVKPESTYTGIEGLLKDKQQGLLKQFTVDLSEVRKHLEGHRLIL